MNSIIQTPTNDLKQSIEFYSKLDFKTIADNPNMISDGKAVIEINPDRFARAGVKLCKASWQDEIEKLEKITAITAKDGVHLLGDPSGTWIYLCEGTSGLDFTPSKESCGALGNYAGISLETTDMGKSAEIWQILGFSKTMGSEEQGWVVYQNGDGMAVSLMKPLSCPHLFFNPSLTYFNGENNLAIIQKIRDLGIPITEEITHFNSEGIVDNIIIRDPGGFGFFIFSD